MGKKCDGHWNGAGAMTTVDDVVGEGCGGCGGGWHTKVGVAGGPGDAKGVMV